MNIFETKNPDKILYDTGTRQHGASFRFAHHDVGLVVNYC